MISEVRRQHFIDGEWADASSGRTFPSINPTNAKPWYHAAEGTREDIDRAVRSARAAFEHPSWRDLTQTARGRVLRRLADLVGEHGESLARTEVADNGKLLREMRGQLSVIPEWLYYFAGMADKVQGETIPGSSISILNYTLRQPIGVVGAITPWNSPLLLTLMKLAPALAGGNTIVIKPSEHTSASLLELMPLVLEAGIPPGVVNVVTGFGAEAGDALVRHPLVSKIAFTGGTETGRRIAAIAGERLVRVTLELGGKSPNIVFPDADLANASMGIVAGIFAAAGQTCVAGSRVFLHDDVYDEVLERVTARARAIVLGDPLADATEIGPLAFAGHLETVAGYAQIAQDEGATLTLGGHRRDDLGGYFFEPTIFTDVHNRMRIAQEEVFGPILAVQRFRDEDDVVARANDSRFGLAAGLWTRDLSRAHRVASRLEAGTVWINTYRAMAPMSPLGGVKDSGLGRENGFEVMREYTRVKSVWVSTSDEAVPDPFVLR